MRTIIEGNHGIKGKNKDCHGKNADHLYIEVCTSIFDVSIILLVLISFICSPDKSIYFSQA